MNLLTPLLLTDVNKEFNEDQPRDESGRWTAGGGGLGDKGTKTRVREAGGAARQAARARGGGAKTQQREAMRARMAEAKAPRVQPQAKPIAVAPAPLVQKPVTAPVVQQVKPPAPPRQAAPTMIRQAGAAARQAAAERGGGARTQQREAMRARGAAERALQQGKQIPVKPVENKPAEKVPVAPQAMKPQAQFSGQPDLPPHIKETVRSLSTEKVEKMKVLGGGVNESYKINLADGNVAVYKPVANEEKMRESITPGKGDVREASAFEVAKLVGMHDLVPVTLVRSDLSEGKGSVQEWRDGKKAVEVSNPYDGDRNLGRAAIFDYVIGNMDRHAGNWVVNEHEDRAIGGSLNLIDHGLSFPERAFGFDGNKRFMEAAANRLGSRLGVVSLLKAEGKRYADAAPHIEKVLTGMGLPKSAVDGVRTRIAALQGVKSFETLANFRDPRPRIPDPWGARR